LKISKNIIGSWAVAASQKFMDWADWQLKIEGGNQNIQQYLLWRSLGWKL
jgi:hypothetical protein